jgi:hypothetical protein
MAKEKSRTAKKETAGRKGTGFMAAMKSLFKKEPKVTTAGLAVQFLDEYDGEVDLAYYSAAGGLPFILPLAKFRSWLESRGYSQPVEQLAGPLSSAFKVKIADRH